MAFDHPYLRHLAQLWSAGPAVDNARIGQEGAVKPALQPDDRWIRRRLEMDFAPPPPAMSGASWPEPPLDRRLQREVRELNLRFVELLGSLGRTLESGATCAAGSAGQDGILGLSPELVSRLSALPPAGRKAVAACPFALPGVHLHDVAFWATAGLEACASPPAAAAAHAYQRAAWPLTERRSPQIRDHLMLVLAFAWHLAHTAPVAARWMLGAGAQALDLLRAVPFGRLQHLADECPGLLEARLGDQRRFWDDLVGAAETNARHARFAAVSLGLQLSAVAGASRPVTRVQEGATTSAPAGRDDAGMAAAAPRDPGGPLEA
jgi:hypothetical protein